MSPLRSRRLAAALAVTAGSLSRVGCIDTQLPERRIAAPEMAVETTANDLTAGGSTAGAEANVPAAMDISEVSTLAGSLDGAAAADNPSPARSSAPDEPLSSDGGVPNDSAPPYERGPDPPSYRCPTSEELIAAYTDPNSDLTPLSDEFDTNEASSCAPSFDPDGTPPEQKTGDFESVVVAEGRLTLTPEPTYENGWSDASRGPSYLRRLVIGDFVVEARVSAVSKLKSTEAPLEPFTDAALLLRRAPGPLGASDDWLKYGVGYQATGLGRGVKQTENSVSALFINYVLGGAELGAHRSDLRICRLGDTFRFYHKSSTDSAWTPERFVSDGDLPTGLVGAAWPIEGQSPAFTDGQSIEFTTDLGNVVEVSLVAELWQGGAGPWRGDIRGEFDFVHLARIQSLEDCTRELSVSQ
jgi:hypothetical protein